MMKRTAQATIEALLCVCALLSFYALLLGASQVISHRADTANARLGSDANAYACAIRLEQAYATNTRPYDPAAPPCVTREEGVEYPSRVSPAYARPVVPLAAQTTPDGRRPEVNPPDHYR
jgi:hypothetical protein